MEARYYIIIGTSRTTIYLAVSCKATWIFRGMASSRCLLTTHFSWTHLALRLLFHLQLRHLNYIIFQQLCGTFNDSFILACQKEILIVFKFSIWIFFFKQAWGVKNIWSEHRVKFLVQKKIPEQEQKTLAIQSKINNTDRHTYLLIRIEKLFSMACLSKYSSCFIGCHLMTNQFPLVTLSSNFKKPIQIMCTAFGLNQLSLHLEKMCLA